MKIYLLQLVILMSLSLNLQAQNLSGTIRGKVTCHGKGLQGVVVTDGIDCVLTNKSGRICACSSKGCPVCLLVRAFRLSAENRKDHSLIPSTNRDG